MSNYILRNTLSFLFFFSISVIGFSQNWEIFYSQDFSGYTSLNAVPDQSSSGLSPFLIGGGAGGQTGGSGGTDNCARGNFYSPVNHLSFLITLDPAYEYRFSWTARTTGTKTVQLYFGNTPGSTSNLVKTSTNLTSTYEKITSDVISGVSGATYLVIKPATGSALPGLVYLDDFIVERRALVTPTISLVESSLIISEGGTGQVCLEVNDIGSEDITVSAVFQGTDFPHFDGVIVPGLVFPANDTSSQCISITTVAANGITDANLNYTLDFSIAGGGAEMTMDSILSITIEDDEPPSDTCYVAGFDQIICPGEMVQLGCETNSDSVYCFRWVPEEGLDNKHSPRPFASPEETTEYTLYITDDLGNIIKIDRVLIEVRSTPELIIEPSFPSGCFPGQNVDLLASSGFSSYLWSDPSSTSTANLTVTEAGVYSVTATDDNNCESVAEVEVFEGGDPTVIKMFFESKNFYQRPINIIGPQPPGLKEEEIAEKSLSYCNEDTLTGTVNDIQDLAKLMFNIEQSTIEDLESLIRDNHNYLLGLGVDKQSVYITKNETVCDCPNFLDLFWNRFTEKEQSIWIHLFDEPGTNNDILYILGNYDGNINLVPNEDAEVDALNELYDFTVQNPNLSEFPTVGEQLLFTIQQDVSVEFFPEPGLPEEADTLYVPCAGTTSNIVEVMSPSGIPIRVPEGTLLKFNVKPKYRNIVPEGAVSSFATRPLQGQGIPEFYASRPNDNVTGHEGYFSRNSKKPFQYPAPLISNNSFNPTLLGVRQTYMVNPEFLFIEDLGLEPDSSIQYYLPLVCPVNNLFVKYYKSPFANNFTGIGPLPDSIPKASYDEYATPIFPQISFQVNCPPPISFEDFDKPFQVKIMNEDGGEYYWIFSVFDVTGKLTFVQCRLVENGQYEYTVWDCAIGDWVDEFDPPNRQPFDLVGGLIQILYETVVLPTGIVLDVVTDFLPIVGEVKDVVIVLIELSQGNYQEAAISAILAAVPFIKIKKIDGLLTPNIPGHPGKKLPARARRKIHPDGTEEVVQDNLDADLEIFTNKANDLQLSENSYQKFVTRVFKDDDLYEAVRDNPGLIESWDILFDYPAYRTDISLLQSMFDDIVLKPDFAIWIKNNPDKVRAWEALHHPTDIPLEIRTNVDNLEFVADYLRRRPYNGATIKNSLRSAVNKQNWIDLFRFEDYVNTNELVQDFARFTEMEHIPWSNEYCADVVSALERIKNTYGTEYGRWNEVVAKNAGGNPPPTMINSNSADGEFQRLTINIADLEEGNYQNYQSYLNSFVEENGTGYWYGNDVDYLINHEFGHNITSPNEIGGLNPYFVFTDEGYQALASISQRSLEDMDEALAEIFSAFEGGVIIHPELKTVFNQHSIFQIP